MLIIAQARTSLGSSNFGTEFGPEAILLNSLLPGLKHNKIAHKLLTPVASEGRSDEKYHNLRNFNQVVSFNKELYTVLTDGVDIADQLVTLGGDHSVGIGSMSAAKRIWPDIKVVYIDAHPDCHKSADHTTSGNIHGLPVSTVLGDGIADSFDMPKFKYDEFFMLGIKDIDDDEQQYLNSNNIKHITMDDITGSGVGAAMADLQTWATDCPLHVALDIDGVDQSEAPGTGILNKGGLSYREISFITRQLSKYDIKSIDLVEVNPAKDKKNKTVNLAAELIINMLGGSWSAYTAYMNSQL